MLTLALVSETVIVAPPPALASADDYQAAPPSAIPVAYPVSKPTAEGAIALSSPSVECDDFNRPDHPTELGSGPLGAWLWWVGGHEEPPGMASIVNGEAVIKSDGISLFGVGTIRYADLGANLQPPFEVFIEHRVWIPGDWASPPGGGSGFDGPSKLVVLFGLGDTPSFDTTSPAPSYYGAGLSNSQQVGVPNHRNLRASAFAKKPGSTVAAGNYIFESGSYVDGRTVHTKLMVFDVGSVLVKSWYPEEGEPEAFYEIPVPNPPTAAMRYLILENESNGWNYTMPETIPDPQPDWRINQICVDTAPAPPLATQPVPEETEHNNHPNEATVSEPVSTYSGALAESYRDVAIPGRGPAIDFVRSYHSNDTRVGSLGPGWTHSYATRIHLADDASGDLYLIGPEGRSDRYTHNPDGTFTAPPGVHTELVQNADGSFVASHKDNSRWTFDTGGRLSAVIDRYGNTSTMTYGAGGRLVSIGDPAGRGALTLSYTNGLLTSVRDWAAPARTVTYQYDANNRLWKVTDREGKTTTYTYDGTSHRLATVTNGRGKVVITNTYDAQGRVATQKDARGLVTGDVTSYGYVVNPDGTRVTTVTAPATSFEPSFLPTVEDTYDANGWLVQRRTRPTSTDTLTQLFTYDATGDRASFTDPRGSRTDYCYDVDYAGAPISGSSGNLTRVISPPPIAGAARPVTLTAYDASDNVIQTVAPKGAPSGATATCSTNLSAINATYATDHAYDPTGAYLLSTTSRYTDPDTGAKTAVTKFEYLDASNPGLVTRLIPPRGNSGPNPDYTYATAYSYYTTGTQAGLLKDATDALGNKTAYTYDSVGRRISVVDQLGNAAGGVPAEHTTTFIYDNEDRVRFARLPAPTAGGSQLVTEARYDEAGNAIVRIDANGQVTTYAYDDRSSLYQVKESPLTWTDPAVPPAQVFTTEYTRDAGGNPTRITRAKGDPTYERVMDYVYDGRGLPRSETQYPAWPTTSGPLVTTFGYDAAGNLATLVDPLGRTLTTGFDGLNRRTSLDYSDPATPDVTFGYDANNNRTSMLDGTGTTTYVYDEANRPISVTSPGSKVVGYRYDLDGNRTKLIYPDATAVSYTFDKGSRLASLSDWASRQVNYQYWPDGMVKQATNPNGTTATYAYDNARRLFDIRHARSSGQQIDRFFYTLDGLGNILSTANGSLATQFARPDGLASSSGTWTGTFASINEVTPNDATFLASPVSPTTSHFYEVTLADVDVPGVTTGVTFRYRYAKSGNNSGKTINLTVELRQGTTVIASQAHTNIPGVDGSGWQQGNVTLTPAQAALITNGADLRIRFRPSSSGGGQGRQALVSWAVTELPGAGTPASLESYTSDRLSRLTGSTSSSGSRSYTYDPAGNRLTRVDGATTSYVYDRADRMTSAGAVSVTVDANGNLTAKGPDTFAFDQANRLVSATVAGATEAYVYDGDGRRFSRQVGVNPATRYISDAVGDLAVTLDDGSRKYVYGLGLAYAVSGTSIEVYHTDNLGSTRDLTDSAGVTVATYKSDDWGRPAGTTGSSSQPFGYTGEPRDQTGLTYLRTRYYDPDLGRFLSRDIWPGRPGAGQTQNRYVYVGNNPITDRDPTGRVVDTALDVGFIFYDVWSLIFGPEKEREGNLVALGADVGALFVPFVTGAGLATRGLRAADHLDDAVGGSRWLDEAAQACSFTAETLVATPGGAVAISSIDVGDIVLAWDESSGRVVERLVTAVLAHADNETATVRLDGGVVIATPDHPFLTMELGWVEAGLLRPGVHVITTAGTAVVEAVDVEPFAGTLWDLTVEGAHTFFVGQGEWLVHNCPVGDVPSWVQSAGATVSWAKNIETAYKTSGTILSPAELDRLVQVARANGVDIIRLDPPHLAYPPWDIPHLKIGDAHVPVPEGYQLK